MQTMVKVKICGIQSKADVMFLNRYLPDYAGLVFAESKRQVGKAQAKAMADGLDESIKKVGVFVHQSEQEAADTAIECGLDVIQIHGDRDAAYFHNLREILGGKPVEIWKAVRVKDRTSIETLAEECVDAYVLDTYKEDAWGGTGSSFDWGLAAEAQGRIILAGGLNPENVGHAIQAAHPFAVDVSSGVETNGHKDMDKIKEFIFTARNCG
jgi:phosphoribosylanthranilate isomerase